MRRFTADQARRARVAAQGLGAARATTVVDAVRRVVGLQGQDPRANRLGVRVRTDGLTAGDVDAALRERVVVRTWAMRGTLHMIAPEDFWWVNSLLGPYFAARGAPRRRQLGLDEHTLERAAARLEDVLGEPMTRHELVARLGMDLTGQAPAHLLAWAANVGLVCRGPETDTDEATYVLARDWLEEQPPMQKEAALAQLAERYLAGYGPATAEDLAAWSGLPITQARAGLAAIGDLVETVDLDGRAALLSRGAETDDIAPARLLGHFDAYLLGYRGRHLAVPDADLSMRIHTGGGFVMPTVLVDGLATGTWRSRTTNDTLVVHLQPGRKISTQIRNEVTDLGRFLGRRAVLGTLTG